jgi:putative ABC transport system permease protein
MRLAFRSLCNRPVYALTVGVVLALGIGGNAALFSVVDSIVFKPLPYPHPEQLIALSQTASRSREGPAVVSPATIIDWDQLNTTFVRIAGSYLENLSDIDASVAERVTVARVSPGFFATLGVAPLIGRPFTADEEKFDGSAVAIVSASYWRNQLHEDRAALGRSLHVTGTPWVVVGVMPPSFQYPSPSVDMWLPAQTSPILLSARQLRFFKAFGRLNAGVTKEQGLADLARIQQRLGQQFPRTDAEWTVRATSLKDELAGDTGRGLWLLFAAVGCLLLVACGNVAGLMLAEGSRRARDIAVRVALGASRRDILRGVVAEGLWLSMWGGCLALIELFWLLPFLRAAVREFAAAGEIRIDVRVVLFIMAVCGLTAVLCAIVPAWHVLREDAIHALTFGGRSQTSRARSQRILITAQIGMTFVLLVTASLLARSFLEMESVPLGFDTMGVLDFRITGERGETPTAVIQRQVRTLGALASIPGVRSVALTSAPVPRIVSPSTFRLLDSRTVSANEDLLAVMRSVSADYFSTLRIPILAGTTCAMDPTVGSWKALVNRRFVRQLLGDDNPIGRRIVETSVAGLETTIIGVVGDAREDGVVREPQPTVYLCGLLPFSPDPHYLLRSDDSPTLMVTSVRSAIHRVEPNHAVYGDQPLNDVIASTLAQPRLNAIVVVLFASVALVLAAVGLYGVITQWVVQRQREIGIYLALGASPSRVIREVFGIALTMVAVGLVFGFGIARVLGRLLQFQLFHVRSTDPLTFGIAAGAITAVTLAACVVPAKRAANVDPLTALRQE